MNAGRKWFGLLALAGLLWGGGAVRAQEQEYEFGVVPYLKNYPEFKRGPDPWANLSGTVQENVDLYGGKLNLSLALPGLPWSETSAFAPVLRYSSNVWSYREPLNMSLTLGGERSEPEGWPFDPRWPQYKYPDYWGNDAWTRFSPIGRPHAMPGWTLAIGGVYTEVTFGAGAIGETYDTCYRPLVEKRYFVSPDGAAHLLVDLETDNRPFFTRLKNFGLVTDPSPEWLDAISCEAWCDGTNPPHYCLPLRRSGADRAWRAVDGSGYYYVESQHKVYGPDGTTYELAPDGEDRGRITRMTDLAGNAITIGRIDEGGFRTFRYTGPTGAAVEVVFEQRTLPNYVPPEETSRTDPVPDPIEIWLLHHVTAPVAGGGTLQWSFTAENLVEHLQAGYPGTPDTVTWGGLFHDCEVDCPEIEPYDSSGTIFAAKAAPGPENMVRNAQIFVLTAMTLPDGRRFRFDYNRAGKVRQVAYPDGGRRVYEYGNTLEPSISSNSCDIHHLQGWQALNAGESPFGAVSLVWQDLDTQPGGETLERAYAYSGYDPEESTGLDPTVTLSWQRRIRADGAASGAVQLNVYCAPESMTEGREILQFGQPAWQTGKLQKAGAYGLTDRTEATDEEFLKYFRQVDDTGGYYHYSFTLVRDRFLTNLANAPLPLLRETETVHENWSEGWNWLAPDEFCTPEPPEECSQIGYPGGFYSIVSPGYDLLRPEWNPVVAEEWTREYAPDGSCLTSKVKYVWGDAETPGGKEGNACLLEKREYGWGTGETAGALVRKQTYEYWHYWPAGPDPDLPARRLALPKLSETEDAGGQKQAAERTAYSWGDNPAGIGERLDFWPAGRATWRGGEDWIQTNFSYGYLDPDAEAMVRQTEMKVKDAGVVKNTVRYAYTAPEVGGLLRKVSAAPGTAPDPELYLLLDYDPGTGLLLRRADGNGDTDGDGVIEPGADDYIEFAYDGFNRLAEVRLRHGAESLLLGEYAYTGAGAPYAVTRTDWLDETRSSRSRVQNDALGRPAERWASLNEDTESYSRTEYDPLGRAWKDHLPVEVPVGERAALRTAYQEHVYDALDREVETKKPAPAGRAQVSSRVEYGVDPAEARTTAKVFDEEDRWRRLGYDGLGRLQRVDEPDPAEGLDLQTSYTYDTLDRLTEVAQGGQEREFAYDAAGRLLSAKLPEYGNGTMSYQYDDLGNVTYKHLGSYTEELFYDWLGRLTGRSVSLDGQVTVYEYEYDTAHLAGPDGFDSGTYTRGRLVYDRVTHPAEAGQTGRVSVERFFAYDWRGNLIRKTEQFTRDAQAEAFTTTFEYDRQGNPTKITYPSGQEETLAYERGRLAEIAWNGQALFDGLAYAPHGAAGEAHGHGPDGGEVTWAQKFNERNWPAQLFLNAGDTSPETGSSTLVQLHYYGYENNGNITDLSRAIRPTAGETATAFKSWFAYDGLNRLAHFEFGDNLPVESGQPAPGFEGRYLNPYDYIMDRWGNVTGRDYIGSGPDVPGDLNLPVDTSTNRLSGGVYDGLGNQTQIEQNGTTLNLNYLDQGHVWEVRDVSGNLQYRYYYDADGKRRIKAKASDGLTNFQEDASYYFYDGESLACQLDIGELVQEDEEAYQPKFLMLDHLGSTRAEITFAGTSLVPTVSGRYDYMPFGQFINVPATAPEQVCFTGKPRDGESKLDFFGARYYSQFLCRWSAPDQLFADSKSDNPQSWNLYQYVRNNPVIHVDNNGKATEIDIILRDSPAFDMAAAYQSFWSVGEVTLYKTTVKELVDVVLNEARSDKITDLEISGHGGLGAITIGRESVQLSTIPGQIIDPAHVTEFNRLNGKFADGGTITFNMCGPNSKKERVDPNLVNEMIDERKQVLQEIANATGAIVRAPSGGYVALSQGNAKGSYWIIAKPAAASANSQDAKQSNTSDKPDQN